MLKVAITGGIGSGKSTAARLFRGLGCPTLDLDQVSREVTAPGQPVLKTLAAEFGEGILQPNGELNRKALGDRVFAEPAARIRLEGILHPAIREAENEWIERYASLPDPPPAVIIEIPLLFESGLEATVDRIVLVTAPLELRIARLVERGLPEEQARLRIAAQLPDDLKRNRSHYVIQNDGNRDGLKEQVEAVWKELMI